MRSASGRKEFVALPSSADIGRLRAWGANDIRSRRRREAHLVGSDRAIAHRMVKDNVRCLSELIIENHAREVAVREAEARAPEVRIGSTRLDGNPIQTLALAGIVQHKITPHIYAS
jgi:hypothetical protein